MTGSGGPEGRPACVDPDWLCAVALWVCGYSTVAQLTEASLAWLPTAPDSDALYHLADDALSGATRCEDVLAWVDGVFTVCGLPKPSPLDFRWITTRRMVQREWAPDDTVDLIRFLSSLAFTADMDGDAEVWNLLSRYRYYDFAMDDDVELDMAQILDGFRSDTRPALLRLFTRHFEAIPDAGWVLDVFQ
ncbi:hypothetical protein GCM10023063_19880 [Arthrobacter methylotrophus]|uniref:Transposase n=1 Tax=Arthrobacter methylotrophus TaxID=121291 RepID=A0ABV5UPD9_9MICC